MTLERISSPDDLTTEWMTTLLRSTGDIDASVSVTAADVAPFGSDESMMSALYRVGLTYDAATEAPSSIIVKLTSENEGAQFIAAVFQLYQREIRFYNELLPRVSIRTPRCLHAEMYPDDQGFILVLEEVSGCRNVDQIEGMNFADASTALEALADLHAPFWGNDLSDFTDTLLPFDCDLVLQGLPMKTTDDWAKVRSTLIDELPPEVCDLLDNVHLSVPRAIEDIMSINTIVHGDCRADNLLFDPDGEVIILDFQLMGVGHGMFDVAYLISQSLAADAQERATELIDVYLARIASHGIEVDIEQAMAAYRGSVMFNLGLPMSVLATDGLPERGEELARTMLQRASQEILRTGGHIAYGNAQDETTED